MGAPPRVAIVAPFGLRPKGTTISRALPIARLLSSQGAAVRLVIPPWDDRDRAGHREVERGVEIIHTVVTRRLTSPNLLMDVLRQVDDLEPTVVHVFKPIGYSGAAALWLAHRRRRLAPRVVVDTDDLEGPSGWAGRRQMGIQGRIRGIQERTVLRTATHVTVASAWLRRYAARLGVPEDRLLTVPNGFEPFAVPVSTSDATSPSGHLLWYTRFTEASPSRAAALLAPLLRHPDAPRLTILGEEVNQGDREALRDAFATEGVEGAVDWLGYDPARLESLVSLHRDSLVAIYPLDDDAVNRARCPAKVPQLMALGLPVVAEGVGELTRYLDGFEAECLAPVGDEAGFRARVASLLQNPERRLSLGRRLHAAAASWTWERTAGGLLDFYRQ